MSAKDITTNGNAFSTSAEGPPLLRRKSVLMGLLTSGFVIASAAQASSASASTVKSPVTVATTLPVYALQPSVGLYAKNNGVVGDGVTDDGAALNALLVNAATLGVPVVLTPLSTVFTTVQITPPTGTRLHGNGATIKCGITSSIYTPTIGILNVSNVIIENLQVNGQKAKYATNSEFQHGIGFRTSTDIVIRDCVLNNNAGDGIEIAGNNATTWSERITLQNVVCSGNNRNGLSVIACKTLRVIGGSYSYSSGTAPNAGIDIEPNNLTDPIEDIVLIDVLMEHNGVFGFLCNLRPKHTVLQEGIRLNNCTMRFNGSDGACMETAYHVTFTDCSFNDNKYGIETSDQISHLTIRGGTILRNTLCGILGTPVTISDVVICGVRILDNVGYGIRLSGAGERFLIDGNVIGNEATSNTKWGIATQTSALSYVSVINNYIRGLSGYALGLSDNTATRFSSNNAV